MGFGFINVTTVGVGEGGVPCISVKYLIYLNINKIKLFVKKKNVLFFATIWALSWGQKRQSLVQLASACPWDIWAALICDLMASCGFSACQDTAAVSSEGVTALGLSAPRGQMCLPRCLL